MRFDWIMFIKTLAKILVGIFIGLTAIGALLYLINIFYEGGGYSVALFMIAFTITTIRSNWRALSRPFETEFDFKSLMDILEELPKGTSHLESVTGVVVTTARGTYKDKYEYRVTFEYIGNDEELYIAVEYANNLEEVEETIRKGVVKIKEISR